MRQDKARQGPPMTLVLKELMQVNRGTLHLGNPGCQRECRLARLSISTQMGRLEAQRPASGREWGTARHMSLNKA